MTSLAHAHSFAGIGWLEVTYIANTFRYRLSLTSQLGRMSGAF